MLDTIYAEIHFTRCIERLCIRDDFQPVILQCIRYFCIILQFIHTRKVMYHTHIYTVKMLSYLFNVSFIKHQTWSTELATMAQSYADSKGCTMVHSHDT